LKTITLIYTFANCRNFSNSTEKLCIEYIRYMAAMSWPGLMKLLVFLPQRKQSFAVFMRFGVVERLSWF